jgi:ATP-dependent DNA helicase DinG
MPFHPFPSSVDTEWAQTIRDMFAPDGWLHTVRPASKYRHGQSQMAHAVAQAIESQSSLLVEAGTGTGKTFAYMLPVLLSGKSALISTATRNLQDQLFKRDLPELLNLLALPLKVALLKGRSSYLCEYRLDKAIALGQGNGHGPRLRKIAAWSQVTRTGDLAEFPELDETSPLYSWITSTRDNCLGSNCPNATSCHVNRARKEALCADITVINHHLYFSDLLIRRDGQAKMLPDVDVAVFDEAHSLVDTGIQYLGEELSSHVLSTLARDFQQTGLQHGAGFQPWRDLASVLELSVRDWRLCWPNDVSGGGKQPWAGSVPASVDTVKWPQALGDVRQALLDACHACEHTSEVHPEFKQLAERFVAVLGKLNLFESPCPPDHVRWVEIGRGVRLVQSPLQIADWMRAHAWQGKDSPSSVVLTSATLGQGQDLRWFAGEIGLDLAQALQVSSPFDYARQARLYVPHRFPEAGSPAHSAAVAELAHDVSLAQGGRTMVLTTSLRAMNAIAEYLRQRVGNRPDWLVLCQGEMQKQQLLHLFCDAYERGIRAVLVGSASFWEGVDIPGEALSCVIIDKLPFPSPGDPWTQAKSEAIRKSGKQPFTEYAIPVAALSLKQGAGRLIRHEDDQGLLIIADTRLLSKSYGAALLAALPPMRKVGSLTEGLAEAVDLPELPPSTG